MARKSKLRPAQIRQIYRSQETAKALGERYGLSPQMIYLIKSGRAHDKITRGVKRGTRKVARRKTKEAALNINALADAIIDRVIKRLRS